MSSRTAWANPAGQRDWADRQMRPLGVVPPGVRVVGYVLWGDGVMAPLTIPDPTEVGDEA